VVASYQDGGALMGTGAYYDWGVNNNGQLGDGTSTDSDVPVKVPLRLRVTAVSQGGSITANGQTIATLSDGTLWAWGADTVGQLGNGSTANELAPIEIKPPAGVTYATVACGGFDCYALSTLGGVYAWGQNSSGQIGNGTLSRPVLTPTLVDSDAGLISATALSVVVGER
jgi:alpha-tubulin suppressor-like RCC1 family protein